MALKRQIPKSILRISWRPALCFMNTHRQEPRDTRCRRVYGGDGQSALVGGQTIVAEFQLMSLRLCL